MNKFMKRVLISFALVLLCLSCAQSHRRGGNRRQKQSQKPLDDEGDLQVFVMEKVNTLRRFRALLYL